VHSTPFGNCRFHKKYQLRSASNNDYFVCNGVGVHSATSQAPSTTLILTIMHPRLNSAPSQTDARDETVRSEHNRLFAIGRQLLHEEGECCVVDQVDGRTQTPALPTLLEGAQIAHGPGHSFAWQLLASKPRHQRHHSAVTVLDIYRNFGE